MISFALLILFLYANALIVTLKNGEIKPFSLDQVNNLKGVLAILIILYHLTNIGHVAFLSPFDFWGAPIVSLFLCISGYGLLASYQKKGDGYLINFIPTKLWRIIFPLFFATLVYLISDYLDKQKFPEGILQNLFLYGVTPLPFSWYAYAIISFYLLFYLVFLNSKLGLYLKLFVMLLMAIAFMFLLRNLGYGREWWICALAFPTGMYYKLWEDKLLKLTKQRKWPLLIVPSICLLLLLIVKSKIELLFPLAYIIIPIALVYLVSFISLRNKVLLFLGGISYEIYLLHGAWMFLLRGKTIHLDNDYIFSISVVLFSIISAYIFNKLAKKIIYP